MEIKKLNTEDSFSIIGEIINGDFEKIKKIILKPYNNIFYFSSNGGRIRESAKIHLYLSGGKNRIIAGNKIDSASIIIFLSCEERACRKDTTFTFHYPIFDSGTDEEREKQIENFICIILLKTSLSYEDISRLMKKNKTVNAIDALSYGIVNEII